MVGFTGSRHLAQSHFPLVARVVAGFAGQGCAVGCAAGLDKAVRLAAPAASLQVFRASRFGPGPAVSRLVKRSVAMVQAVAASPSPFMVGFVSVACPPGVAPSPVAGQCFCGGGSGSWATLALAAGLGVPLVVFWCGPGAPLLPGWGSWVAAAGPLAGGWQFAPGVGQSSLF